jgi:hypothetical protein
MCVLVLMSFLSGVIHRIATERHHNRNIRLAIPAAQTGHAPPVADDPPPF